MSERGSFVTEYIYCDKCLDAVADVLLQNNAYLRGIRIPAWKELEKQLLPIIAGKVGGLGSGDEILRFAYEICPQLEEVICHPVRIAVLAEDGERIFHVTPSRRSIQ